MFAYCLLPSDNINLARTKLSDAERMELREKLEATVLPKLRSEFYNWKPIQYTRYKAIQYLTSRFTEEYGIMTKILAELHKRVPDFEPKTLFDFGSGVGTVAHAAKSQFGDSLEEYFCVDESPDMNDVAREIVENGSKDGDEKPLLEKAYFRQFLPGLHEVCSAA